MINLARSVGYKHLWVLTLKATKNHRTNLFVCRHFFREFEDEFRVQRLHILCSCCKILSCKEDWFEYLVLDFVPPSFFISFFCSSLDLQTAYGGFFRQRNVDFVQDSFRKRETVARK